MNAHLILFILFFWPLRVTWALSSLTRDWTPALGSESVESSPLDHQGIPWMSILSEIRTVLCLVAQSCPTLFSPMACSSPGSSVHGDSPGKNTGVGCHALLQGIFPIQESNQSLLHCSRFFTSWANWEAHSIQVLLLITTANIYQFALARYSAKYNGFNSPNNPMILL